MEDLKKEIEEKLLDKNGNPSRLKKKQHAGFLSKILETFPHEDVNTSIWKAYSGNVCKRCNVCNKELKIANFKIGQKDSQKWCSNKCKDSDPLFREIIKEGMKKIDYVKRAEDIRNTCMRKYGVPHVTNVPEIMAKIEEKRPQSIMKMLETNRKTCLERYGTPTYFSSKDFKERVKSFESNVQKELKEFIEGLGFKTRTDRSVLNGKELDILVEGTNIAFEVNGIFWHSSWDSESDRVARTRHLEKTLNCREKGIRLIHLTDTEISKKREIVESMIRSILGKTEYRIPARKCSISRIGNGMAGDFLNSTHIQGWAPCGHFFGLFLEDELVSVMGFSKARFDKNYDWELVRFSSKLNTTVVGGFSKLLKFFRKNFPGSIVSYADFSRSNGEVYLKNGFKEVGRSNPSYRWADVNRNELINRHTMMKRNLPNVIGENYDPNLTEAENLWRLGKYKRLWDCGQLKFVLE